MKSTLLRSKHDLGDFLKELRKASGLTQTQFAAEVNDSQQNFDRYERARTAPPFDKLVTVLDTFDFELVVRPKRKT